MIEEKYCYSLNEEDFIDECSTKQEAIEKGRDYAIDQEVTCFWVGKAVSDFTPSVDTEDILERIRDRAYDDGGEYAEDYLDVTTEQETELEDMLNTTLLEWVNKHNLKPNWYRVDGVEEFRVSEVDKLIEGEVCEGCGNNICTCKSEVDKRVNIAMNNFKCPFAESEVPSNE